jgi:hypothetical protein
VACRDSYPGPTLTIFPNGSPCSRPLSGVVAVVVVACAACAAARAPEYDQTVVVPTPPTATTPPKQPETDPGPCAIAGPKATMTVVVSAGADELSVAIAGAPVSVVPGEGGTSAVAVKGALEFAGRADGLDFFPSSPVVVANGVVELGPMSVLGATSMNGTHLVAKTVEIGPGFQLGALSVPCSALTFVGSGHAAEEAHRGIDPPSLRTVSCTTTCPSYSTPETLDFHALPDDGAYVRLTGSTIVSELERRGAWSRVATPDYVHMDGAQLTGWVRAEGLNKLPGYYGLSGGRSLGTPRQPQPGLVRASGADIYQGPARIEPDTAVFSSADSGHRWATVRDGAAEFEVMVRAGASRAEIRRAPFIPVLRDAWVSVKAVHTMRRESP